MVAGGGTCTIGSLAGRTLLTLEEAGLEPGEQVTLITVDNEAPLTRLGNVYSLPDPEMRLVNRLMPEWKRTKDKKLFETICDLVMANEHGIGPMGIQSIEATEEVAVQLLLTAIEKQPYLVPTKKGSFSTSKPVDGWLALRVE